ncbi:hypothetical protein INP57_18200 [Saccharopolyspora sp. HNM0986]|uniref:hypothetical protein n=1 Tax=Saccharopolyspora galaxeae TaxID=2781241 RepID=UPI00190AE1F1|nr:hypothetical protein [Saccharopolyspora sp. HNM0986]MBK0868747.1 hypothetical protein [Saccharopolyspora sp. HNM0986]
MVDQLIDLTMSWLRAFTAGLSRFRSRANRAPLLVLADALAVLGHDPDAACNDKRSQSDVVPLARIAGTLALAADFDRAFRPLNPEVRARRDRLARTHHDARAWTPIRLIQLGELYFVDDGHHRIALAHQRSQRSVDAAVHRMCTVRWVPATLTHRDLGDLANRSLAP